MGTFKTCDYIQKYLNLNIFHLYVYVCVIVVLKGFF